MNGIKTTCLLFLQALSGMSGLYLILFLLFYHFGKKLEQID